MNDDKVRDLWVVGRLNPPQGAVESVLVCATDAEEARQVAAEKVKELAREFRDPDRSVVEYYGTGRESKPKILFINFREN
jgi:hypothetical protein